MSIERLMCHQNPIQGLVIIKIAHIFKHFSLLSLYFTLGIRPQLRAAYYQKPTGPLFKPALILFSNSSQLQVIHHVPLSPHCGNLDCETLKFSALELSQSTSIYRHFNWKPKAHTFNNTLTEYQRRVLTILSNCSVESRFLWWEFGIFLMKY